MATREVEESHLALLQRAQGLLDGLYGDPEIGMEFKSMLKKKFPKLSIPEIDAAKPHVEAIATMKKEWDDFKKAHADDKLESDYQRRFTDVRAEFQLTDEGMDALKKRMVKDNIADPRAAAALLVHEKPKPIESSSFAANRWDFFSSPDKEEMDDIKSLINDPDAWLDRQIPKIIAEERNKVNLAVRV